MTLAPEKTRSEETLAPSPEAVLEVVQGLARELQPQRQSWRSLTLDASLERDLGLDSLGRVELLSRMEKSFGARLPEELLGSAETPRDLLHALLAAHPASGAPLEMLELPKEAGEAAPDRTRTLLEVLEWHAQRHPERRHVLYYPGDGEPEELTYGELL
ncbi:MAG TPA: acyl carrier protein, partial [Thermoanaerobaculia bacterium]|nr:acyl carrier protein [Thermoanaerobaculia bacterium]